MSQALQSEDETTRENMTQLLRKLLTRDFEAAIHLKVWDDLSVIIEVWRSTHMDIALS